MGDISGEDVLPGSELDMSLIDRIIDPLPPVPQIALQINCPVCNNIFNNKYEFMKHFEKVHLRISMNDSVQRVTIQQ
ncbi:hypothetical protein RhiirA4_450614 [Rhizophagus irregularis]|uniref:C2H2-type domain-containing protein n=1 Tax=Rhizophagus irregularis TaxID=588596 RepID=A0A2I1FTP4_9GLOM|nr:hypothetical protein RhiirA4_450614 [Rhizophagus irregularis]